jgi:hypothetical protein
MERVDQKLAAWAKARIDFATAHGTTQVVPLQNPIYTASSGALSVKFDAEICISKCRCLVWPPEGAKHHFAEEHS